MKVYGNPAKMFSRNADLAENMDKSEFAEIDEDMKNRKEEKERRYYNKKLILDGLKREEHTVRKVNWVEFGIYGMGCFIGLWLNSIVPVEMLIINSFVRFAVKALIVAVCIVITDIVVYKLKNIIKKFILYFKK